MTVDQPDYTSEMVVSVNVEEVDLSSLPIIARPKGGVIGKGDATTTASYATIAEIVITDGKQFQLGKILISCNGDVQYKLVWDTTTIGAEIIVPADTPFTDWFPWDYYLMLGNGTKTFKIQAKYPSGGSAGTVHAEFNGEEVTP